MTDAHKGAQIAAREALARIVAIGGDSYSGLTAFDRLIAWAIDEDGENSLHFDADHAEEIFSFLQDCDPTTMRAIADLVAAQDAQIAALEAERTKNFERGLQAGKDYKPVADEYAKENEGLRNKNRKLKARIAALRRP